MAFFSVSAWPWGPPSLPVPGNRVTAGDGQAGWHQLPAPAFSPLGVGRGPLEVFLSAISVAHGPGAVCIQAPEESSVDEHGDTVG